MNSTLFSVEGGESGCQGAKPVRPGGGKRAVFAKLPLPALCPQVKVPAEQQRSEPVGAGGSGGRPSPSAQNPVRKEGRCGRRALFCPPPPPPPVVSCRVRAVMWLSPRALRGPGDWSQRNSGPGSLSLVRKPRGCCRWARPPRSEFSRRPLPPGPCAPGSCLGTGLGSRELQSSISVHKKTRPRACRECSAAPDDALESTQPPVCGAAWASPVLLFLLPPPEKQAEFSPFLQESPSGLTPPPNTFLSHRE